MRFLKYILLVVLALPLLLVAAMLIAGTLDEKLKAEVVDLVEGVESEHITEQGNAYFALLGFEAPVGADMVETGRKIYGADMRQLEMARQGLDYTYVSQTDRSNFLKFKGEASSLCSVNRDYLYENGVCKSQAETERMLIDNRELLSRYYQLLDYRALEQPLLGFWVANEILSVQRLAQVDIERMLRSGKVSEAASLLTKNLQFWRHSCVENTISYRKVYCKSATV
jgi:hypothetical protein